MGEQSPKAFDPAPASPGALKIARIDEQTCIGCTLCVVACPVDAIVGAAKLMHTVLAGQCTGCELCLPPCPVDCIEMLPAGREWTAHDAQLARERYAQRNARLAARREVAHAPVDAAKLQRQTAVAVALARARARRAGRSRGSR
jgi:Na+-translocating ferredoxin:NAD+ oxidoreductase subunit B